MIAMAASDVIMTAFFFDPMPAYGTDTIFPVTISAISFYSGG